MRPVPPRMAAPRAELRQLRFDSQYRQRGAEASGPLGCGRAKPRPAEWLAMCQANPDTGLGDSQLGQHFGTLTFPARPTSRFDRPRCGVAHDRPTEFHLASAGNLPVNAAAGPHGRTVFFISSPRKISMHQSQLYFKQACPVCGRGMRVRIELFGNHISCGHCQAVSVAGDDTDEPRIGPAPVRQALRRSAQPMRVAFRQP